MHESRTVLPTISAVIPTKNRPQFLKQAVQSLLVQSLLPLEIIVVDDGQGAAVAMTGLSSMINVLDNHSRGPVPARNLGVAMATGELVVFLDDDDWFTDNNYLAETAGLAAGGADLVFCDGTMMFEDGGASEAFAFDADARSLETNNTILISGVIYRRSLHGKLGAFDETLPYYWDWDWYLRVARGGGVLRRSANPAVAIRVHAQNMSGASQEAARRDNLDRLSAKHGLPPIALKNHLSLAREPLTG